MSAGSAPLTLLTFDPDRRLSVFPMSSSGSLQPLRPGVSAQVEVVSSDPSVASITTSPLSFSPGDRSQDTFVDPLTAGTTTITVVAPAGFDTVPSSADVAVTVTAPDVLLSQFGGVVGRDLQASFTVSLGVVPPSPVDVTVTSLAPSIGIGSSDRMAVGASSVTFVGVRTSFVGNVFVQGIGPGMTQVVAQAGGYNDGARGFTVVLSGFVHDSTADVVTSVSAPNLVRQVRIVPLDPATLQVINVQTQALRGGLAASVSVSSADPGVAATAAVPIVFSGGQATGVYEIDPIAVGSTVLTVEPPAGFDLPADRRDLSVAVEP